MEHLHDGAALMVVAGEPSEDNVHVVQRGAGSFGGGSFSRFRPIPRKGLPARPISSSSQDEGAPASPLVTPDGGHAGSPLTSLNRAVLGGSDPERSSGETSVKGVTSKDTYYGKGVPSGDLSAKGGGACGGSVPDWQRVDPEAVEDRTLGVAAFRLGEFK